MEYSTKHKKAKDQTLMLNETIDQLTMASSVGWCGHVLKREYGHVLRRALDYEVEGKRKKRETKKDMEEAG